MLYSYFDDSSDPNHKEYFAVGGLIGGEKQWNDFHVAWAVATVNLKEPFRSTDCEARVKQFKGWTKPQSDALMNKLVSIVLDHRLHGYASVVPIPEYKALFPDCREYDPYHLAVKHTIINMAHIGKVQGYDIFNGIECCFEDRGATARTTKRIYGELKELTTWQYGSLLKRFDLKDKTSQPLQAADLIAREAFKYFSNEGKLPTRIPVDRMRNVLNFCTWDRATLEYLRDNGGPDDLELLTSWESWEGLGRPQPPVFRTFWKDFEPRTRVRAI